MASDTGDVGKWAHRRSPEEAVAMVMAGRTSPSSGSDDVFEDTDTMSALVTPITSRNRKDTRPRAPPVPPVLPSPAASASSSGVPRHGGRNRQRQAQQQAQAQQSRRQVGRTVAAARGARERVRARRAGDVTGVSSSSSARAARRERRRMLEQRRAAMMGTTEGEEEHKSRDRRPGGGGVDGGGVGLIGSTAAAPRSSSSASTGRRTRSRPGRAPPPPSTAPSTADILQATTSRAANKLSRRTRRASTTPPTPLPGVDDANPAPPTHTSSSGTSQDPQQAWMYWQQRLAKLEAARSMVLEQQRLCEAQMPAEVVKKVRKKVPRSAVLLLQAQEDAERRRQKQADRHSQRARHQSGWSSSASRPPVDTSGSVSGAAGKPSPRKQLQVLEPVVEDCFMTADDITLAAPLQVVVF